MPATSISSNKEEFNVWASFEDVNINVTMMRAYRVQVMVCGECLNTTIVARTNFIPTKAFLIGVSGGFRNSKSDR